MCDKIDSSIIKSMPHAIRLGTRITIVCLWFIVQQNNLLTINNGVKLQQVPFKPARHQNINIKWCYCIVILSVTSLIFLYCVGLVLYTQPGCKNANRCI